MGIINNVTIVYNNEEHFDAIRITHKRVHIGRIINKKFEPFGFIPNHSIKQINNGNGRKIDIVSYLPIKNHSPLMFIKFLKKPVYYN